MAEPTPDRPEISRTRLTVGGAVFVAGWLTPLLIPWVASIDELSGEWKAGISGALMLGIPELFSVVAVGILGRDGFDFLKARLVCSLSTLRPAHRVGKVRHRVGVAMFCLPLLAGWASPYLMAWRPALIDHLVLQGAIGDAIFVTSLFVLGSSFWQKLNRLFVRDADLA